MTGLTDRQGETLRQLVQEVLKLKKWQRDVTGDSPLFDIANEHTPDALGGDQNDYDPGYYDVLRMNATQDVSITGIAKGKKGRFLEFYNISAYNITLAYESAASVAANRIVNATGMNIRLFPNARIRLYYDSTIARWIINDLPGYRGDYGMSTLITTLANPSIPTGVQTKIPFDAIGFLDDPYGFVDLANNQFVIPAGMTGFYIISLRGEWDPIASAGVYLDLLIGHTTGFFGNAVPSVINEYTPLLVSLGYPCTAGDTIAFYARQESGGNLTLNVPFATIARLW